MKTTTASLTVTRLSAQGHLIGDEWRASSSAGAYEHHYSATGEVQAVVGLAGSVEVDAAVAAARRAQPGWAALSPLKRAAILYRLADLLEHHKTESADLAALDNGTPISVMNPGSYAAAWVRYYAGWCDKLEGQMMSSEPGLSYVRFEPYGVVAAIPPWNGSMMGMGQKCGPALAAGNAVVAKPPEISPFGMLRFAELALEAGLPSGVLNVVVGGEEAGSALVGHQGVDKITFTGGGDTARKLMEGAARNLTPMALELGGKSPNIVFADADLDAAAMSAVMGVSLLAGQGCALPTRLYVHDAIYDEMVERVVAGVKALVVGDPLQSETFVGPVVTESAMERILRVIDRAQSDGSSLLTGGARLGGALSKGWFVAPTVFGAVDHESDLARNEVFGPVQPILRFHSDDEVLGFANDSRYGLGAYLHTNDVRRIQRFVREIEAGTVAVNGLGRISPATPFGGTKESGFGREGGRAGLEEMMRRKTVFVAR